MRKKQPYRRQGAAPQEFKGLSAQESLVLDQSLRAEDHGLFLQLLGTYVKKYFGFSYCAKEAGVKSKSSIYKSFSKGGNPCYLTMIAVMKLLKIRLLFGPKEIE